MSWDYYVWAIAQALSGILMLISGIRKDIYFLLIHGFLFISATLNLCLRY